MMAAVFEVDSVAGGYVQARPVVKGISISIEPAEFVAIIGPNGSGKTTFLRLLAGGLQPWEGHIDFMGQPLHSWPRRQLARHIAVVPQLSIPLFDFSVREFVALGRTPYLSPWASLSRRDIEAVEHAIEIAQLSTHVDRPITELSGGEFQRAVLARALAQEPDVLLLDEPTAFLDPGHALAVLSVLQDLNRSGVTIVAVFHDLAMAQRATRVVALRDGMLFADGPVGEVFDERLLSALYGAQASVLKGPSGELAVVFKEGAGSA